MTITATVDEFAWYRSALAGNPGPISEGAPQSGYYKMRAPDKQSWLPVAIWRRPGTSEIVCRVAGDMRDAMQVWTFAAKHPVPKEDAKAAFETGRWPGEAPGIGDNGAPDLSLPDQIKERIAQALDFLTNFGVKDQRHADMAQNYRDAILKLKGEAEKAHKAEKAPHLEAGRAVDQKYNPVIKDADGAVAQLRSALGVFLRAKDDEARKETERKHREELAKAEAERARIAAEHAEATKNDIALAALEPDLPPLPPPPEPVKVTAGGQTGKKAALKSVTVYAVTDYAAALAHLKDHPEVVAAVEKVAKAQTKAGAVVPGVTVKTEKVAA